jgi:myo-inositol-1(or 4)-monophosphatase
MNLDFEGTLSAVRDVARVQGDVLLKRWSTAARMDNGGRRDFSTQVDVDVEMNIKSFLRERFPDYGFSGEETEDEQSESDYQWLVDPIDGTKYYAAQASLFSISIALLYRENPALGVVRDVCARRCFHAFQGGGAFLDDLPLQGSKVDVLSKAIVNVDTPGTDRLPPNERAWFEAKLVELTRHVYRVRALGVGALAACWVASGAFDAYVDLTGYVKPYDTAAGRIIMQEAGMELEYLTPPAGPQRLLAAPRRLWAPLVDILKT